jgi:hypothetical protein
MRYVEAPEPYEPAPGDGPSIFLAGGITTCPDWQQTVRRLLADAPVVLLNPRRADFDITRGDTAEQQVAWEYEHLHLADVTMFWFPRCDPRRTVQPIALFELGAAIAGWRRFVVGADDRYPRRLDIELQLRNALPRRTVHRNLADTVDAAMEVVRDRLAAGEGGER